MLISVHFGQAAWIVPAVLILLIEAFKLLMDLFLGFLKRVVEACLLETGIGVLELTEKFAGLIRQLEEGFDGGVSCRICLSR